MAGTLPELNARNFDDAIKSGVTLVDFWAPWCGPCRVQGPILEELAAELGDQAKIAKLNTDESADIAAKYDIAGIPTLIVFKDGEEAARFVGVQRKEQLAEALAQLG